MLETAIGKFAAKDSAKGIPNPSFKLGYTNPAAPVTQAIISSRD